LIRENADKLMKVMEEGQYGAKWSQENGSWQGTP
jgi:hypothetical protein